MITISEDIAAMLRALIKEIDLEESKDDYEDIDGDHVEECKDSIIGILREVLK